MKASHLWSGLAICLTLYTLFMLRHRSFNSIRSQDANLLEYEKNQSFEWGPHYFLVVGDLDEASKVSDDPLLFRSYLLGGKLYRSSSAAETGFSYSVEFSDNKIDLTGVYNAGGRGMELSELVSFNRYSHLYAFDDRSGIVYELCNTSQAIPRHILTEGDGTSPKGMKIEWATVKDSQLWVGSFGKEFTDTRGTTVLSYANFWVAVLNKDSDKWVRIDWEGNYNKMRRALNCSYPGYLIHEAVNWSPHMKRWIVLPRRVSNQQYDDILDEMRGSNLGISASEDFTEISVFSVGKLVPDRGFSSFKFVPNSLDNLILALKTTENVQLQTQETFLTLFETKTKRILIEDLRLPLHSKFEGLEFVPKNVVLAAFPELR